MGSPTSSPRILSSLKSIDAHPKVDGDFAEQTSIGGAISATAAIIMTLLFVSELRIYMTTRVRHEMTVDTDRNERMMINFDISFPMAPCSWISLDAMDISGELKFDLEHEVYRRKLDPTTGMASEHEERHNIVDGKFVEEDDFVQTNTTCGSCYGAEDVYFSDDKKNVTCCETCRDVKDAYRLRDWNPLPADVVHQCRQEKHLEDVNAVVPGEGCQLRGTLTVNKVAGNFHFAPGRSYQRGSVHVHDLKPFDGKSFDFTHRIHHLSFGYPYPGIHNPLDNVTVHQRNSQNPQNTAGMFQYFLKVVPTTYVDANGNDVKTNQYSVTEHFTRQDDPNKQQLPGVFFFYDMSPIKVQITEEHESIGRFLTGVCAIIGGVFTVSGIIDAVIYRGQTVLAKKMELGKLN